ncbi:hypothetical protein Bsp3421_001146 [Burkholderia sp. FERM BP-3421]|uniref:hypothetical protein n=1 Tax=Burkholderia sp. FERM BP-3421 TaxID=1494466 RepID=UPI00235E477E|nr:hypothetical protein [Burkholderia sp. FERM BP-3421]WDD91241.1 hypothetical protein Bsp3421_001146 [Burkholderia sp. FERM BP-3421]
MNRLKIVLGLAATAAICASGVAQAARVGVYIGPGYPYYYPVVPAPYYYPPPVVAVPVEPPPPPEYIEQGQAAPMPMPQAGPAGPAAGAPPGDDGSWYYCDASKKYYPYVKQCKSGWRAVPPRPQP